MTFDVRTRSQANRLSSESRSPSPKRSRNEDEDPKYEEPVVSEETASSKTVSPIEEHRETVTVTPASEANVASDSEATETAPSNILEKTYSEDTVIPSTEVIETGPSEATVNEVTVSTTVPEESPKSEHEQSQTPEQDENDVDDFEDNAKSFFSFPSLVDPKDKVANSGRQSPEIIQLDDENSTSASSPTSTAGPQLPRLSTLETGKESEFASSRRRPPFRRPASSRRRRKQPAEKKESKVTVTQQQQSEAALLTNNAAILAAQQANLFRKPLTPIWNMIRNFPKEISNDYAPFYDAMCQWRWETIDEIKIPVILRGSQKLVAHSVAHIKLFSKFPTNVASLSQYLPPDVTLESLPMNETEAWMMNFINTIVCNYELGMQIFQNGDTLVELQAMELYYFFAKKHYLEDLLRIYDGAVPQEALQECKNIIGAILNLKKKILDDLKQINEQIKIKYRPQNQSNLYFPSTISQNQLY